MPSFRQRGIIRGPCNNLIMFLFIRRHPLSVRIGQGYKSYLSWCAEKPILVASYTKEPESPPTRHRPLGKSVIVGVLGWCF